MFSVRIDADKSLLQTEIVESIIENLNRKVALKPGQKGDFARFVKGIYITGEQDPICTTNEILSRVYNI